MNDRYGTDRRRFAEISRFTPLDKQKLLDGAFDIDWFNEAYTILGLYATKEDAEKEMREIIRAIKGNKGSYNIKYAL